MDLIMNSSLILLVACLLMFEVKCKTTAVSEPVSQPKQTVVECSQTLKRIKTNDKNWEIKNLLYRLPQRKGSIILYPTITTKNLNINDSFHFEILNTSLLTTISEREMLNKSSQRDLRDISRMNTTLKNKNDQCVFHKSKKYVCIYKHSGLLKISVDKIFRFGVTVRINDSKGCFETQTFVVHVVPTCFPMNFLYKRINECFKHSNTQAFVASNDEWNRPNHIIQIKVDAGVIIGRIEINKGIVSKHLKNGNVTLYLKSSLSREGIQPVYFKIPINPRLASKDSPNTKISIPLLEEVYIGTAQNLSLSIKSSTTNTEIKFPSKNAIVLVGAMRQQCPRDSCRKEFKIWRAGAMSPDMQSLNCGNKDPNLMNVMFSYCQMTNLHIEIGDSVDNIFQKPHSLTCEKIRNNLENQVKWYKDSNLLRHVNNSKLQISGLDISEEGDYYCEVADGNKSAKSNVLKFRFSGSIWTKFSFGINISYYRDRIMGDIEYFKNHTKRMIQQSMNATMTLNYTTADTPEIYQSKTYEDIQDCEIIGRGILKPGSTVQQYYKALRLDTTGFAVTIVEKTIKFYDRDYCLTEFTRDPYTGDQYLWDFTQSNKERDRRCNHESKKNATRQCKKETTHAYWLKPDLNNCIDYAARKERELKNIFEVISKSNLNEVSTRLKNLTSENQNLTEKDIIVVKDIVRKIVKSAEKIEMRVAKNILEITGDIMNISKTVLGDSQTTDGALNGIIKSIEETAEKLYFPPPPSPVTNVTSLTNKHNFIGQVCAENIGIAVMNPEDPESFNVEPVKIKTRPGENLPMFPGQHKPNSETQVEVTLPKTIFTDSRTQNNTKSKLNFIYYGNSNLFPVIHNNSKVTGNEKDGTSKIISSVFSLSVSEVKNVKLSEELQFTIKSSLEGTERGNVRCVFWNFSMNEKLGGWSNEGCRTIQAANGRVTCSCSHLTNFAVLFSQDIKGFEKLDYSHRLALSLISYIGCGLSVAGICISLVALLLFKLFVISAQMLVVVFVFVTWVILCYIFIHWQKSSHRTVFLLILPSLFMFRFLRRNIPSKVLLGLCVSLGILMLVFMFLIDAKDPPWLCTTSSVLLHFLVLNCFLWMLVEAMTLYLKVVKVIGDYPRKFLLKATLATTIIPVIVVSLCFVLREEDYKENMYCVVSGVSLRYGLFFPVVVILLINAITFILVVWSLCKTSGNKKKLSSKDPKAELIVKTRIAVSCCVLLGLTWLFGVFAIGEARLVFQYLFCIFNSLQGLFILYFNVFRQLRASPMWKNLMSRKRNGAETTSSYSTNSNKPNTTRWALQKGSITPSVGWAPERSSSMPENFLDINEDRINLTNSDNEPLDTFAL